ncbi:MAG: DHHA1 domain-containing protein, partial [Planctomycetota bacterium]|nr:DHHA1 domain-containing protein [Planctomycetota bacterium]
RSVEQVDVQKIASGFGGGGHAKAAGYTAGGTIEEIVEGLRQALSGA